MGLLDQIMGGGQPQSQQRPGLGSTLAAGVVLALLVKGVRQWQAGHGGPTGESRSFDPRAQDQGGGLGGMLGGLTQGGGLGGMLGGLGGAGALGALINRFRERGFGEQVGSWVGHGQNAPIAPQDVGQVLDQETLEELQQKTGLSRDQLLQQLADELPNAINAATPKGRAPQDDDELHQAAEQPSPEA